MESPIIMGLTQNEIRERKIHWVWISSSNEKNAAIASSLETIKEKGGEVVELWEGRLLEGKVLLPFMEDPNECRYFGATSIKAYAEQYNP